MLLKSCRAHTLPDGHQPLSLRAAVHLRRVALLGMIHALTPDLHQGGRVGSRHHVSEHGQVAAHAHAAFIVDAHRGESDAGADVLEGQVEASAVQRTHTSHLRGRGVILLSWNRKWFYFLAANKRILHFPVSQI